MDTNRDNRILSFEQECWDKLMQKKDDEDPRLSPIKTADEAIKKSNKGNQALLKVVNPFPNNVDRFYYFSWNEKVDETAYIYGNLYTGEISFMNSKNEAKQIAAILNKLSTEGILYGLRERLVCDADISSLIIRVGETMTIYVVYHAEEGGFRGTSAREFSEYLLEFSKRDKWIRS